MISILEPHRGSLTRNDEIRKELTAIFSGPSGLTPKSVIEVAKDPRSILHSYFTWDDSEAGRKYREMEAAFLIRRVKVTIDASDSTPITLRCFSHIKHLSADGTIDTSRPGAYMPITEAMKNPSALEQIMSNARSELRAFSVKYHQLKEVMEMSDVFDAIEGVI